MHSVRSLANEPAYSWFPGEQVFEMPIQARWRTDLAISVSRKSQNACSTAGYVSKRLPFDDRVPLIVDYEIDQSAIPEGN
jgi:exodeoxyribonuclease-3